MTSKAGWVYLLASKRNGTLYLGVTSDLPKRIWQHRGGLIEGFSKRYGCKMLVWCAPFDDIEQARARELQMKRWKRAWKLELIETDNPQWRDLWDRINA
jgi:putative endonuclease